MQYIVGDNFSEQLAADLDKKYLASGVKLGGDIKENKIKLYTTDDYGKHSSFAARTFYGKLDGNKLSGKFSISLYVVFLLGVLLGVCIESIVMAALSGSLQSMIFPIAIIIIEIVYFFSIKKISSENDKYIKKYLEACVVED
ncbi:MAG: hypothetical protein IJ725_00185 [Ruminococcus sp.]|nr:hypothetical protein [Ruminococcus sp.]